jgi:hypothetical protein
MERDPSYWGDCHGLETLETNQFSSCLEDTISSPRHEGAVNNRFKVQFSTSGSRKEGLLVRHNKKNTWNSFNVKGAVKKAECSPPQKTGTEVLQKFFAVPYCSGVSFAIELVKFVSIAHE